MWERVICALEGLGFICDSSAESLQWSNTRSWPNFSQVYFSSWKIKKNGLNCLTIILCWQTFLWLLGTQTGVKHSPLEWLWNLDENLASQAVLNKGLVRSFQEEGTDALSAGRVGVMWAREVVCFECGSANSSDDPNCYWGHWISVSSSENGAWLKWVTCILSSPIMPEIMIMIVRLLAVTSNICSARPMHECVLRSSV